MSSGAPPAPAVPPGLDVADAVLALRQLVDIANLQADLIRATNFILVTGAKAGAKGGGGAPAITPDDFRRVFESKAGPGWTQPLGGRPKPRANPALGFGRWLARTGQRGFARSRAANWGKKAQLFGRGVARTLGGGKRAQGVAGAAGKFGGAVVGAAVDIGAAAFKMRNALNDLTESSFATAKALSQMSGSMAVVVANREVEQMFRDMERGEATAESAGRLQKSESARKDEENKIAIMADNIGNELKIVGNDLATEALKLLNTSVSGPIADLIVALGGRDPRGAGMAAAGTFESLGLAAERSVDLAERRGRDLMDMARRDADAHRGVPRLPGA